MQNDSTIRTTLAFHTATDAPANVTQAVNIARQVRLMTYQAGAACEIRIGRAIGAGKYDCEISAVSFEKLADGAIACSYGTISL